MNDALLKNKAVMVVLFTGIERTNVDVRTPRIVEKYTNSKNPVIVTHTIHILYLWFRAS